MSTQPGADEAQPRGGGRPAVRGANGHPAWAALHERMRDLLEMTGTGSSRLAAKYGFERSTVARYFSTEHLCGWDFMQLLMTEAEQGRARRDAAAGQSPALTADYRRETFERYRAVLLSGENPHLLTILDLNATIDGLAAQLSPAHRTILDLTEKIEQVTAQLSPTYYEIAGLEARNARLRGEGREPGDQAEHDLRARRLQADQLRAARDLLRAQVAAAETELPPGQWFLHDPGRPVPPREPQPSWWQEHPSAVPGVKPAPPRPGRPRGAWLVAGALLVLLAAAGAWIAALTLTGRTTAAPPPTTAPVRTGAPATTATSAPGQTASPGTAGFTVKYSDTGITMPAVTDISQCGLSYLDFDQPKGFVDEGLDFDSEQTADLFSIQACSSEGHGPTMNSDRQWGTAPDQPPAPAQCLRDAQTNAKPAQINAAEFTVGSAYCLITDQDNVAWFEVTANTGQGGYSVVATLWNQD